MLYLVHAHIGYMLIDNYASEDNKYLMCFLVFSFVMLLSSVIHIVVERKISGLWKAFFKYLVLKPVEYFESRVKKGVTPISAGA